MFWTFKAFFPLPVCVCMLKIYSILKKKKEKKKLMDEHWAKGLVLRVIANEKGLIGIGINLDHSFELKRTYIFTFLKKKLGKLFLKN